MTGLKVLYTVFAAALAICLGIVLGALLFGCAATGTPRAKSFSTFAASADKSVEPVKLGFTDAQCYSLMKSRDHWMFTAKLLGGVGGLGALAAPPWDDDVARWSIAASAATLGVAGIAAAWVGDTKSDEFEKFCTMEL